MKKGFTLIELIVAVAVFAIVIVAAVNIFIVILQGQRKALALQNVQENARYIMDSMAKEIRMMINIEEHPIPEELTIDHPSHGRVRYLFDNSAGEIKRKDIVLNSSAVEITGEFYVQGDGANEQRRVTIFMTARGKGLKPEQQTELNLQTTVSRRSIFELAPEPE